MAELNSRYFLQVTREQFLQWLALVPKSTQQDVLGQVARGCNGYIQLDNTTTFTLERKAGYHG